jgi:pimeloyl-ACP methyl ester carboxylesterase
MRQLMPNYVARRDLTPPYDARRASKRAWRGTNRSLKAVPEDYLERPLLDAPVMIVQGRQDVIRETNAVLVSRYAGASNIWIEDAAHFPWFEQPEVFAKTDLDFYRSAMSGRSCSGEWA